MLTNYSCDEKAKDVTEVWLILYTMVTQGHSKQITFVQILEGSKYTRYINNSISG